MGWYYFEKSENDKSIKHFENCLKADERKFDAMLGLAMIYYLNQDKISSKKYFDEAKISEPILSKGMDGIVEIEKDGYSFSEKKKELLKKMFEEFK